MFEVIWGYEIILIRISLLWKLYEIKKYILRFVFPAGLNRKKAYVCSDAKEDNCFKVQKYLRI